MAQESKQKWLERNRPPRVQISYNVETNGAELKKELPFLVGVLADLAGNNPENALPPVKDRRFVDISRDNFNEVLKKTEPQLVFGVDHKLGSKDDKLKVNLKFRSMEDFKPEKVAAQVPAINELLEARKKLTSLLSKMYVNDRLANVLDQIIDNTQAQERISKENPSKAKTGESSENK